MDMHVFCQIYKNMKMKFGRRDNTCMHVYSIFLPDSVSEREKFQPDIETLTLSHHEVEGVCVSVVCVCQFLYVWWIVERKCTDNVVVC